MTTKTENEIIHALMHKTELQASLIRSLLADRVIDRDPHASVGSLALAEVAGSA